MHAAAAGKSTLGIPKKVGEEFANSDPGGALPRKIGGAPKSDKQAAAPHKTDAEKTVAGKRKHRPIDYGAMVSTAKSYAR